MELGTIVIIAVVAIAVLAVGFWLVPYLKKRGLLKAETIKNTQQFLDLVALVIQNLKIGDKDVVDTIFGVCQKAVFYVEQTMADVDAQDKKLHAMNTVVGILSRIGIELTEENKHLIEVGIESAVKLLPKESLVTHNINISK